MKIQPEHAGAPFCAIAPPVPPSEKGDGAANAAIRKWQAVAPECA